MISVSLSLNEQQLQLIRNTLSHLPGAMDKAIARAINRAAEGARTDAIKEVCEEYTIKPADVRKTIHIARANPKKLEARVISTGRPTPLVKFNVKPKSPPPKGTKIKDRPVVIVGVRFGNQDEFPYSFVAEMQNGHKGVFTRNKDDPEYDGRLPIRQEFSLSPPQMINNLKVLEYIEKRAQERLDKELTHQISYLLGGGK
jgi:hypothetical protein